MLDEKGKMKSRIDSVLLESIGRMTVDFAMLEHSLSFFIWQLMGYKQFVGQAVTAQLSFRQLIDIFASLFRLCIGNNTKLKEIVRSLNHAAKRRNQIVHSFWGAGGKQGLSMRFKITAKAKNGLQHQSEKVTVEDIQKFAEEIESLSYKMTCLMVKVLK